jgi:hypothetical protein
MKRYISKLDERIVNPKEKIEIKRKIYRPGDLIYHYKFGVGQIESIDFKTYSIPFINFFSFDLDEVIYRDASEFEEIPSRVRRMLGKNNE